MTVNKKHFYSIKERKGYARKDLTVFEVMVRIPDYRPFPISVGGMQPYTFKTYNEAKTDCERRIKEDIERGIAASFEDYIYNPSAYDYQIVYEDMLDPHNKLEIKFSPKDYEGGYPAYKWHIRFFDEEGEYYGSSSGDWHDTQAAAEADGRLHYLMEKD